MNSQGLQFRKIWNQMKFSGEFKNWTAEKKLHQNIGGEKKCRDIKKCSGHSKYELRGETFLEKPNSTVNCKNPFQIFLNCSIFRGRKALVLQTADVMKLAIFHRFMEHVGNI